MEALLNDLRFAVRLLITQRAFSIVALLMIALGIGANTAVFSLLNAVLWRPLPGVERPERLVTLLRTLRGNDYTNFSYPDYVEMRDRNQSFAEMSADIRSWMNFSIEGSTAERVRGDLVTGNYFSLLGVRPEVGRLLTATDDAHPGDDSVVILSYSLWKRAFNADRDVIGRNITLNGHTFTIVGVAARDFTGITAIQGADIWLPLSMTAEGIPRLTSGILQNRNSKWLRVFGRLKDGTTVKQANTEVATLGAALASAYPEANEGSLSVFGGFGLDPDERSDFKGFLGILQAAVLLLLLMACCNVANLLLVRASQRQREIAIRLSLGAGRRQVIRQLLVEGLLLSFLGGVIGLLLAPWASDFILAFEQPTRGFSHIPVKIDTTVLLFTLAIVGVTGLVFGLVPALQTWKPDLVAALKTGGSRGGFRRSHVQKALVVFQVAISLVLLIGAGLAVRTMRRILAVNTGFNSNNLLLVQFDLIVQGYAPDRGRSFYNDLLDRVEQIPGVKSASYGMVIPPAGDNIWLGHLFYPGQEPSQKEFAANWDLGLEVDVDAVGPNYFETIGTPLVAGRDFNSRDDQHSPDVAIVNQKLADRLWPGENPVGKRIVRPSSEGEIRPPIEIVGVAKDSKFTTLTADAPLVFYQPLMQTYDGRATLIVRTDGKPTAFVAAVTDQVSRLDRSLPVFGIRTMAEQVDGTLWQQRTAEGIIGSLGLLALIMASVGIYGVMSHFVSQRTQEIGIRIALGARQSTILTLVLNQGLILSLAGALIGVAGGFALARQMSSVLFGVGATDPATYLCMSAVLLVVAGIACYVPASKAARVDPMVALRYE